MIPNFDSTFYVDIESHVASANIGYLDAIIHWCEKNTVDVEHIAPLIVKNPKLQLHLQREGENLNFLPKTVRLPI